MTVFRLWTCQRRRVLPENVRAVVVAIDPGGAATISRRLSEATPPEKSSAPLIRPQRGRSSIALTSGARVDISLMSNSAAGHFPLATALSPLWGEDLFFADHRGCRFAQPPADFWHPAGVHLAQFPQI